ncbi:MAG: histone-lysine N-methyltransferase [Candidatus Latescibacterota bacterium]|nr:MAG: histone-lysine N-methyltransferase [Candidatus Latescibacterota bacterium]RKY71477.1 MAG: histone-lysine N-methyltransferase [Candidatus Latescibacterota bacterium]
MQMPFPALGRRYRMEDVEEPNLLREVFPYTEVPKLVFDGISVPMALPEEIWITDTTFRDGQQARPPYTVEQILRLFKFLHRLGGPKGIIRKSEFFLYSERDREAVERCLELDYEYPEVTGWIRANPSDLKLVRDMGLKETGILTSVSDYHIFLKLGKTRKEAMDGYLRVVREAVEMGINIRCHFEDVTRADIYGFCIPFAQELMKIYDESGIPIVIRLCDTMGFGVPFAEASLPRSVPKLVHTFRTEAGVPPELLEWHGHNDFHMVLVNAVAAWLYGCAAANGTLLGYGERTGNPPIEALAIEYASIKGTTDGMDLRVITDVGNFYREIGSEVPSSYPFVGDNFNVTRAGIHADGVIKNPEIYNIFDTERILGRPLGIAVTDKSGVAGIALWINEHLGLKDERRVDKRHPGVAKIYKEIQEQYAQGRVTGISDEEMWEFTRRYLPELFESEFDRIKREVSEMARRMAEELAEHPDVRSMDPARMEPVLEKFLEQHPSIQLIYVTDTEGWKITKNITQKEERAAYATFGLNENFSNREWFIEPMKTGKAHVMDFYISKRTGALCITSSAPIRDESEQIVGIIGIDFKFERLAKLAEEHNIPTSELKGL